MASILRRFLDEGLAGQIARGGAGSFAIKLANTFLGLLSVIMLARYLGPDGFGLYSYVFALVSLLAIPAQFGLPKLVVRETARAQVAEDWARMRGVWRWTTYVVLVLALSMAMLAMIMAWVYSDRFSGLQFWTFACGMVLMPLMALARLRGAALQGLRRVVLGQLPEGVVRPVLFIVFIFSVPALHINTELNAALAMGLHVLASGIAFMLGAWILYIAKPNQLNADLLPIYEVRRWLSAAWPLALIAGMQQINTYTDIIMLGIFIPASEVGIYRVAVQGAMFVIFGLQSVGMFVSPYFARLYAQSDMERLQRLVTLSSRLSFFTAVPLVTVLMIWGTEILGFLFGESYENAYVPMAILLIGQLINALFGSVGMLLSMTGHERDTARGVMIAAFSNVVLNLILIPEYGMNGAAVATSTTLIIWNVLLWRDVRRRMCIDCMAVRIGSVPLKK